MAPYRLLILLGTKSMHSLSVIEKTRLHSLRLHLSTGHTSYLRIPASTRGKQAREERGLHSKQERELGPPRGAHSRRLVRDVADAQSLLAWLMQQSASAGPDLEVSARIYHHRCVDEAALGAGKPVEAEEPQVAENHLRGPGGKMVVVAYSSDF